MRSRWAVYLFLAVSLLGVTAFLLYNLPPVHERLAWRVDSLRTQIRHAFNPPEQAVFVPVGAASSGIEENDPQIVELSPSATPGHTPTPTELASTATQLPSPTPIKSPTPIPEAMFLNGAAHEYQQMNNCGPATLSMALSYWDWQGDQRDTRAYLRPNFQQVDDKNVNPSEMVAFVEQHTGLSALARVGGDVDILKALLAAGFPVVIEKGQQPHPGDWMGHYVLFTGYDDTKGHFISQDSYIMPDLPVPYEMLSEAWWRDFNYTYIVIYPPEREPDVLSILGPHADETNNYHVAAEKARQETSNLDGRDQFFAWYNLGTNLVALGNFAEAAQAYDRAFNIYPTIPEDDRPWRMLWYQVGPYEAYYHSGRFQDIITLGNQTLDLAGGPILEETFYWLGLAREAEGDMEKAVYDFQKAYEINPLSTPARQELQRLGIEAP